jgi:hypothetical protein
LVSSSDVTEAIFGYGQAKAVLFAIILLLIGSIMLLYQQRHEQITWKVILALFLTVFASSLAYYNFAYRSEPAYNFTPNEIWMGNESQNVSQKDLDRLLYLQDNLMFAKRSFTDTPSRFDYSDDGSSGYLDRAGLFFRQNVIRPEWDVHIYIHGEGDKQCKIFKILLFFPNQRNVKHDLDFEYIELYFKINNENSTTYMIPDYVSFPTYADFVAHPRIFLRWDQMPILYGDIKCLALDPDTNSFAEKYDMFPKYNKNFRPSLVTPDMSHANDYLTETEQYQLYGFTLLTILAFLNILINRPDRLYLWVYLTIVLFAIAIYPLIALQFDFVMLPTFRVWTDSTPENTAFQQSISGREYLDNYGVPWERNSWNEPDNTDVCS